MSLLGQSLEDPPGSSSLVLTTEKAMSSAGHSYQMAKYSLSQAAGGQFAWAAVNKVSQTEWLK